MRINLYCVLFTRYVSKVCIFFYNFVHKIRDFSAIFSIWFLLNMTYILLRSSEPKFFYLLYFKRNNEKSVFIFKVDLIDKNDILYIWLYSRCIYKVSFADLSYILIYWYIVNCVCKRNILPIFKPSNNLFQIIVLKFIYQFQFILVQ